MPFTLSVYAEARAHGLLQDDMMKQQFLNYIHTLGVSKVYLEIYRGHEAIGDQPSSGDRVTECFLLDELIDAYKRLFEDEGVTTAAGLCIGTWYEGFGQQAVMPTGSTHHGLQCFSSQETKDACLRIVERAARNFDEFIIDDLFIHRCFCDVCLGQFNDRYGHDFDRQALREALEDHDEQILCDWACFAGDVLTGASELMVNAARKINPRITTACKFPIWNNETLFCGLDARRLAEVYDTFVVGTETRDGMPGYYGYSNFSYMKSILKDKATAAWFDIINGCNIDLASGAPCYRNQMQMSVLAGAAEIILFSFPEIIFFDGGAHAATLQSVLPVLRTVSEGTGEAKGLPVRRIHKPLGLRNEEAYLVPFLGSSGIPLVSLDEPDANESAIELVTVYSADRDYEPFLAEGGILIVTSEAAKRMIAGGKAHVLGLCPEDPIRADVETADSFVTPNGQASHPGIGLDLTFPVPVGPILNPQAAEALLYAGRGHEKFPIVLKHDFGPGRVYCYCLTDFPPYLVAYYPEVARSMPRDWIGDVLGVKLAHASRGSFWKTLSNVALLPFEHKLVLVNYNHCPIRLDVLFNRAVYGKSIVPCPHMARLAGPEDGWERFGVLLDAMGLKAINLQ